MNVNNDHPFLKDDIQALREEVARPEAKGELILKLQRGETKKSMSLITKLSVPTAVTALAVIGAVTLLRPSAMASPASVAKALREAMSYTIRSFTVNEGQRVLQSEARMENGKKTVRYFDANGNVTAQPLEHPEIKAGKIMFGKVSDIGNHLGIKIDGTGTAKALDKAEIDKLRSIMRINIDSVKRILSEKGDFPKMNGKSSEMRVSVNGVDGKKEVKYFVNGKEVKELPKELSKKLDIESKDGRMLLHLDSKDLNIDTKQLDDIKSLDSGKIRSSIKNSVTMMADGKTGKMDIFQSGQTSAEYLIKLLADESKWNIERGVMLNGQKLDKFTFKGPMSPIELFVDPASSLPKVLRFRTILAEDTTVEDVYEYGQQPTRI